VINVPARVLAQPLRPDSSLGWPLGLFAIFATLASLYVSRWIFSRALLSYRSASS
jgi:ABC-2 type transport system permease protein